MKKDKIKFEIIGKSTGGKFVVKGIFCFYDTIGLPLDILFEQLDGCGFIPSWIDFYNEALSNGWKHKTIIS